VRARLILPLLVALIPFLHAPPALTRLPRSASAVNAFKRLHPCPATGQARGPCPGWIIDHVTPLCAGGADAPTNMQWQTRADALAKDRDEWRLCRKLKTP